MNATESQPNGHIRELTPEEGKQFLDARARHYLGIDADEFLRRWDAGAYRGEDSPEVLRVVMAIPFARG